MTGKWAQPGVPHKGWRNTGVYDLGSDRMICEMCESREIRYAHYMSHSDYAEELAVGCHCTEAMEDDYEGPKRREKPLINAGKRKANWLQRNWQPSRKGNDFLRTDGFVLTVFTKGTGWSGSVIRREPEKKAFLHRIHATSDSGKMALFDALIYVKERW